MPKLGYLLPTLERTMEGRDETGSLPACAEAQREAPARMCREPGR